MQVILGFNTEAEKTWYMVLVHMTINDFEQFEYLSLIVLLG